MFETVHQCLKKICVLLRALCNEYIIHSNISSLQRSTFCYLGQEAFRSVVSIFFGKSFEDRNRFWLRVSDADEDGLEVHLVPHLLQR